MQIQGPGKALTIYVAEEDKWHHKSLYVAIVEEARKPLLAGATAFQGIMGYGAHSRIHTTRILDLSVNLPVVIKIIDKADRIDAFLPVVAGMVTEGLVTVEDIEIITYRHRDS
jgi:PII-like signaling protein